jgi:hypothetical protein
LRVAGIDGSIAPVTSIELKPDRIQVVIPVDLFLEGRVHWVRCFVAAEKHDPAFSPRLNAARDRGVSPKMMPR